MNRPTQSRKLPTSQEAETFWISQQERWDCWLAALRMALRFWGNDIDYDQMLSQLLGTSLRISLEHGGFFPYLAIMASHLGFGGWMYCPLRNLPELAEGRASGICTQHISPSRSELLSIASQCKQTNFPRFYLYQSLALLDDSSFSATWLVFRSPDRPSLQDILGFLEKGMPVVVYVHCDEFYQLPDDDSGHLLTFIPVSDNKRGYLILDGYRERGYRYFSIWEHHLTAAQGYDWTRWSDWLLAIAPLKATIQIV